MNQELVLEKRLIALREEHRKIDDELNKLYSLQSGDEFTIKRKKREKLMLRDQIAYLEKFIYPDVPA